MLKIGTTLTLLLSLLLTLPSRALANLPTGQRLNLGTTENPNILQCYNFEEYKLVLKMSMDNDANHIILTDLQLKLDAQSQEIDKLNKIVQLQVENYSTLEGQKTRLYNMWVDENKKRLEAENRPRFSLWVGWGLAGVGVAVSLFLGGMLLLK